MEFSEVVHNRRSVKSYDIGHSISEEELTSIFEEVVLTPSAFNLQHWAFVVVRGAERQEAFKEIAWGQPQVAAASAAILVCAKLDAWADAPAIFAHTPKEVQERSIPMITDFYQGKEQLCRDEAIRSASMAAMSLMYAAKNRGYATGPMIGFDQAAAAEFCELPENIVPVMLVVLGKEDKAPRDREPRRSLSEVVKLESYTGNGLGG